jgi:hypothetical protein
MKVHASALPSMTRGLAGMVLLTLTVTALPAFAFAQQQPPLAEVARQEAERRKTVKGTQKVITTKDLPESARRAPGTAAPASASGEAAPAAGAHGAEQAPTDPKAVADAKASAKPDVKADAKDEAAWRARMEQAREAVRRNEAFAEALQSRINGLTRDFVNRDNPVQRSKIGEDRQKALDELERVRNEVEQSKKRIADIEEEARKAGVPAGWLR